MRWNIYIVIYWSYPDLDLDPGLSEVSNNADPELNTVGNISLLNCKVLFAEETMIQVELGIYAKNQGWNRTMWDVQNGLASRWTWLSADTDNLLFISSEKW